VQPGGNFWWRRMFGHQIEDNRRVGARRIRELQQCKTRYERDH
jgi:hypothetical protein